MSIVNKKKRFFHSIKNVYKLQPKAERLVCFQELAEILNEQNCVICLIIPHLEAVMDMIDKNLFRPLPVLKKAGVPGEMGMDEEELLLDPSWPHLQVDYK